MSASIPHRLDSFVTRVEEHLANTEETTANPVLVMLTGLPGTGKSHLAHLLAEALPFTIIESDQDLVSPVRVHSRGESLGAPNVPRLDGEAVEEGSARHLRCY
jgi:predicted alpha/beta-fold hydrolase